MFEIRRIYEAAEPGYRVLVDRLWPRGISKAAAALDLWAKELAPSTELRKWYHHEGALFEDFADRYRTELGDSPVAGRVAAELVEIARDRRVILLTATRDMSHSGAGVLADYLTSLS